MRSAANIDERLSRTFGPQVRQYEYSGETGLNVVQSVGPRLIIGNGDQIDWKVAAIQAIVRSSNPAARRLS